MSPIAVALSSTKRSRWIWKQTFVTSLRKNLSLQSSSLTCSDILDLRYQLLHRTAAAILEAQRFAACHALMLVHSFSAKDAWLNDYHAFAERMGARDAEADVIVVVGERGGVPLYLSWVRAEEPYARV